MSARELRCEMREECVHPVTHIDTAGFIYCAAHGAQRRQYGPCRKLRDAELRKLQRGESLARY